MASFLVVVLAPMSARAQSDVSAADAIRRALDRPEAARRLEARLETSRARLAEATVTPTPRLTVSHEQVFGDVNVGYLEFSAMVEQSFDLSGWRASLGETSAHKESALRAEADGWTLAVATSVRESFFGVRYREERLVVLDAWIDRLERGIEGIEARQAQGDVSAYQTLRIERELELARARRAAESAALAQEWAALERWTAWESRPDLVGALRPSRDDGEASTSPRRPQLERLGHLETALELELDAWGTPGLRDWSVGVGYRYAQVGPSVGQGALVTLSVPLALWNTDTPRLERLRAQRADVRSELTLRTHEAERRTRAERIRLDAALDALDLMPDPSRDADLSRLARVAFDANEASLTELLDAFESEANLQLARIDLQWEARRAAIALDHSLGLGVPR
jgi:outer membrane protein TolC